MPNGFSLIHILTPPSHRLLFHPGASRSALRHHSRPNGRFPFPSLCLHLSNFPTETTNPHSSHSSAPPARSLARSIPVSCCLCLSGSVDDIQMVATQAGATTCRAPLELASGKSPRTTASVSADEGLTRADAALTLSSANDPRSGRAHAPIHH